MESVKDNLRWLTNARRVPSKVVQMIFILYPGMNHIPGMIVPLKTPRDDNEKQISAERNKRRKRCKRTGQVKHRISTSPPS